MLLDNIRAEVDKGHLVGAVFIDLSKAFDTISHDILLKKLSGFGVKNKELGWFTDYLFMRDQSVFINDQLSEPFKLLSGVPQGSILGPLLFLIFFNDFKECLKNCSEIEYADDTVIYLSDKSFHIIENKLLEDMENVSKYFDENNLIINLSKGKTESMLFGTSKRLSNTNELDIFYRGKKIVCTSSYKYLGSLIDPSLNLNEFFNKTYKKASTRLRLLEKMRIFLTAKASFITDNCSGIASLKVTSFS